MGFGLVLFRVMASENEIQFTFCWAFVAKIPATNTKIIKYFFILIEYCNQ
jgi:hypothetical protein